MMSNLLDGTEFAEQDEEGYRQLRLSVLSTKKGQGWDSTDLFEVEFFGALRPDSGTMFILR